jgi:hypothetical protein
VAKFTGDSVILEVHDILPEILVTPAQLGAVDKVCVIDTSLNQYKGIWITN